MIAATAYNALSLWDAMVDSLLAHGSGSRRLECPLEVTTATSELELLANLIPCHHVLIMSIHQLAWLLATLFLLTPLQNANQHALNPLTALLMPLTNTSRRAVTVLRP